MPYLVWLTYIVAVYLIDQSGIAYALHRHLATLLTGVIGFVGFLLVVNAYAFLAEKLEAENASSRWWRVALNYGLLLVPAFILLSG